jgi:hypothetical protein
LQNIKVKEVKIKVKAALENLDVKGNSLGYMYTKAKYRIKVRKPWVKA